MKTPDKNKVYDLRELSNDEYNKVQELCQTYPKSRGKYFVYSFDRWVISVSGNFYTEIVNAKELFQEEVSNPQPHYFNEPKQFRSLFELSHILELNEWEFDILKRLVRCRKKGQFAQDIQKIKDTADIYLIEHGTSNN